MWTFGHTGGLNGNRHPLSNTYMLKVMELIPDSPRSHSLYVTLGYFFEPGFLASRPLLINGEIAVGFYLVPQVEFLSVLPMLNSEISLELRVSLEQLLNYFAIKNILQILGLSLPLGRASFASNTMINCFSAEGKPHHQVPTTNPVPLKPVFTDRHSHTSDSPENPSDSFGQRRNPQFKRL